ncbi:sulfatase-like hydrolase/transferase [Mucilaginibacter sp.]|uniref:sulfatase-like hydrolase/transferase n=1 Tax=Mucilaginibacter sp. TaxID=1882438 RepID=UPI00284B76A1|nr:sulfatase-like hydrolase/transferase [Mucilaginibacter sp.]MDR3697000.1 sulfatase-like hydrolase/transferase [Mucilaginibacter sp.]
MSFKTNLKTLGQQPDIILIITDQQRATQHFPIGWEEQNLPNLTFLKKNGFSFDRAFCNTCMCSPSRATLFTGTYPAQHGVSQTLTALGTFSPAEIQLDNSLPNMMNMLQGAGYDVQYRGKWHLSKGTTTYYTLTAADVALYGAMGWVPPDSGEDANPLNFGGGYANHDARYVAEAVKYLKEVKVKRANGKHTPYCLIVSLVNPHDVLSYLQNASLYGYHGYEWSGREIDLPNSVDEQLLRNKKPMAQAQALAVQTAGLGALTTDDDKLNYINFYGYLLSKVDTEISYITNDLYAPDENGNKLADTAIVIQTSDHGEMGLAHGGLRQKMFVSYEEALRVPLVISNPVLFKDQQHRNSFRLASLVDLMPTIAEIAAVPNPPPGLRGVSLVPVIENNTTVQDSILFAYDDTKAGLNNQPSMVKAANRVRCIRTEEWKYDYYFHAMGSYANQYEMYNLFDDPGEITNMAYDPKCTTERKKLKNQLQQLEIEKLHVHDRAGQIV